MDTFGGVTKDPTSLHRYLNAATDPVDELDPSGKVTLSELSVSIGVGALISAGFSAVIHRHESGQQFWSDVGTDALIGGLTAPIGGFVFSKVGELIAPLARAVLSPLFAALGRAPNLTLIGESGLSKVLINMSRYFFRTLRTYPSVSDTYVGRILQLLFPNVEWETHHILIQQAWSRVGGPNQIFSDIAANEGLRRMGNGLWNLIPLPRALNAALGQSKVFTAAFASLFYGAIIWGADFVDTAFQDSAQSQP